jgi:hypothetical protein
LLRVKAIIDDRAVLLTMNRVYISLLVTSSVNISARWAFSNSGIGKLLVKISSETGEKRATTLLLSWTTVNEIGIHQRGIGSRAWFKNRYETYRRTTD